MKKKKFTQASLWSYTFSLIFRRKSITGAIFPRSVVLLSSCKKKCCYIDSLLLHICRVMGYIVCGVFIVFRRRNNVVKYGICNYSFQRRFQYKLFDDPRYSSWEILST